MAALEAAGCERIFREKASGGRWERPQFLRLLNQLRSGDVVVVWKLDRLSRSLRDVLTIMEQLGEAGAEFRVLTRFVLKYTLRAAHLELGGVDLDLAAEDDVLPLDRADMT